MAKEKNRNIRRILVRLRLSYASGRDILYGISRYARTNLHWDLHLAHGEESDSPLPYPDAHEFDGIITTEPLADAASAAACTIPLVVIGTREKWLGRRMSSLTFVRNDDKDVGRQGADYFMKLGRFRAYGFVPTNTPYYCSILRAEGFCDRLDSLRSETRIYAGGTAADGSAEDLLALGDWLKALPKPAAVMAVHDLRATHVITAARTVGIRIPTQLAVIGVDNDEILCDFTEPQLTSIAPDHVREGELAAAALERLLRNGGVSSTSSTLKSKAKTIVERESASSIAPAAHLAEMAMSFVRKNALKGIKARDVATQLKVSRRLLDLRFRACYGRSILETIIALRIAEVKKRLTASSVRIGKATAACGFPNANAAQRLFRKSTDMTMREWRQAHAKITE